MQKQVEAVLRRALTLTCCAGDRARGVAKDVETIFANGKVCTWHHCYSRGLFFAFSASCSTKVYSLRISGEFASFFMQLILFLLFFMSFLSPDVKVAEGPADGYDPHSDFQEEIGKLVKLGVSFTQQLDALFKPAAHQSKAVPQHKLVVRDVIVHFGDQAQTGTLSSDPLHSVDPFALVLEVFPAGPR